MGEAVVGGVEAAGGGHRFRSFAAFCGLSGVDFGVYLMCLVGYTCSRFAVGRGKEEDGSKREKRDFIV